MKVRAVVLLVGLALLLTGCSATLFLEAPLSIRLERDQPYGEFAGFIYIEGVDRLGRPKDVRITTSSRPPYSYYPLRNARLELYDGHRSFVVYTDRRGHFYFSSVRRGQAEIVVTHGDYRGSAVLYVEIR